MTAASARQGHGPGSRTTERSTPAQWSGRLSSAGDTRRLGCVLGRCLRRGEVLALFGELGTGKTTLVRGLAEGVGVPTHVVSSPSFVLVHEYHGRLAVAHADLYRLESDHDLQSVGLSEYFDGHWAVAIEWADKCGRLLPDDRLEVHLTHRTPCTRDVRIQATGPGAASLLRRMLKTRPPRPTPKRATKGRRHA